MKKLLLALLLIPLLSYSQIFLGDTKEDIEVSWNLVLTFHDLTDSKKFLAVVQDAQDFTWSYVFSDYKETCEEVWLITGNKDWVGKSVSYFNEECLSLGKNKWMTPRDDGSFMNIDLNVTKNGDYLIRFY